VVPPVGRKEKTSDLGEVFFVLAFVERKNKNKICTFRTSCRLTHRDLMSFYPTHPSKFSKNIVPIPSLLLRNLAIVASRLPSDCTSA
jgi:hypothetical protein